MIRQQRAYAPADQAAIFDALYGLATIVIRSGPRDISLTAAATLATLGRTGPRRLTDLARTEGVTQPSMTALVSGLERAGLVERLASDSDKRVVLVALTRAGADHVAARRRIRAGLFADLVSQLPPDQVRALELAVPAINQLRELDSARRETEAAGPAGPAGGRGKATQS